MARDRLSEAAENLARSLGISIDPDLWSANDRKRFLERQQGAVATADWKAELEGVALVRERWNALLFGQGARKAPPFKWSHSEIVRRAVRTPPREVRPTVTCFTDWIFGLYTTPADAKKLLDGRKGEGEVLRHRKGEIPIPSSSQWRLEYDGTEQSQQQPIVIPSLLLGDQAMRGRPDLVFREKRTNCLVIVEIKVSDAVVPSNGWPNLRAQLWAYSKINWNASEIRLAGEIWPLSGPLRRPETLSWSAADSELDRECAELFAIFAGHVGQ